MAEDAELSGSVLDLAGLKTRYLFPDLHPDHILGEPGIVIVTKQSKEQALGLRHAVYRPFDPNAPGIYEYDCIPLLDRIRHHSQTTPNETIGRIGVEAEVCTVDETGEPYDLHPSGKPIAKFTSELWRNTFEVQTEPQRDSVFAYNSLQQIIKTMTAGLSGYGAYVDPASVRMQDVPGQKDLSSSSEYGGAWVRAVKQKGSDLYKFIGVGIHEHHDVVVEDHPLLCKYLRVIASYLNLGLHAAPFAFGEVKPNMQEIMRNDELQAFDGVQPSSVRYLTRLASNHGGVGQRAVHDNLHDMLRDADILLKKGSIYSPARVYGNHADVRNRIDAPPNGNIDHVGRIELCVRDTGAFRLETNRAYGELTSAVINRLVEVAAGGEGAIVKLHREYSELFGNSCDNDIYANSQLDRTHRNSIAMAYYGSKAKVEDGNGQILRAADQFKRIVDFARPLNPRTLRVLRGSVLPLTQNNLAPYLDDTNLPSLRGYYETGRSTPAAWMIARAQMAAEAGMKEKQIMTDGTKDRVSSFLKYIL